MPIQDQFQLPDSARDLPVASEQNATFFLNFISSVSPETKEPWCPDVRAALPPTNATFAAENAPSVGYVHVGQKPEYVELGYYSQCWNTDINVQVERSGQRLPNKMERQR